MPDGEAPLLKERRHLRREDAEEMWGSLLAQGWKRTEPLWGASAEPRFRCLGQGLSGCETGALKGGKWSLPVPYPCEAEANLR